MKKIFFYQLGCTKNQVDSEKIIYDISDSGIKIIENILEADIAVVNTCGFIETAKQSSIEAILDVVEYKKENKNLKIYVIGCLVKRYKDYLKKEIPEVDGFYNFNEYDKLKELLKGDEITKPYHYNLSESANVFYLKISEGCSNHCSYCAIPLIRGELNNFPIEEIETEFNFGINLGYNEVDIIAQDLASYKNNNKNIIDLIKLLLKNRNDFWLRLLYIHPFHLNRILDQLIDIMKADPRICRYLDIPFQHISDNILKKMNRKHDSKLVYNIIDKLKNSFPDIVIRSSFIVGFPSETEDDFNMLKSFISNGYIDRAGFFGYSHEEDTVAYNFDNQIDNIIIEKRVEELQNIFGNILLSKNKEYIGTNQKVLIDDIVDKNLYTGRTMYEAPEIDNIVYVESNRSLDIGSFTNANIIDAKESELYGEII